MMNAKMGGKKKLRVNHVFASSQSISSKIFINFKGKSSNFIVEKPRRHMIHVIRMDVATVIDWRKLRKSDNSIQCEILELKRGKGVKFE